MAREEFAKAANYWKHWVIYSTVTFLSIFVFIEFAISVSLLSVLSPSTFMFYFTPLGFFLGEALVSLFASALLFVGLFIVLRLKVYVKKDNSLKFNRSKSYLMLPFYLITLASLGVYISLIPLELSNILTYAVFLILFESFIEHIQVSDYTFKPDISLKIPDPLKKLSPTSSKTTADPEQLQKTIEGLEKISEVHEKAQSGEGKSDVDLQMSDKDFKQMVSDLYEIMGEEEEVGEETLDRKRSIEELTQISGVGKKRAVQLYENGLETPQDIMDKGLESLAGINHIGSKTAKKIFENAKELQEDESKKEEQEKDDEIEAELDELEDLLLEDQ